MLVAGEILPAACARREIRSTASRRGHGGEVNTVQSVGLGGKVTQGGPRARSRSSRWLRDGGVRTSSRPRRPRGARPPGRSLAAFGAPHQPQLRTNRRGGRPTQWPPPLTGGEQELWALSAAGLEQGIGGHLCVVTSTVKCDVNSPFRRLGEQSPNPSRGGSSRCTSSRLVTQPPPGSPPELPTHRWMPPSSRFPTLPEWT